MKKFALAAALVAVSCSPAKDAKAPAEKPSVTVEKPSTDQALILKTYDLYNTELVANNGPAVLPYMSQRTFDYNERMMDLALNADKETLKQETLVDQLFVFKLRNSFEAATLSKMESKDLITFSVDNDWVGGNLAAVRIADIKVEGDMATSVLVNGENKLPYGYTFYKEDGNWKLDLSSIGAESNKALLDALAKANTTPDDYMKQTSESMGMSLDEKHDVWTPMMIRDAALLEEEGQ